MGVGLCRRWLGYDLKSRHVEPEPNKAPEVEDELVDKDKLIAALRVELVNLQTRCDITMRALDDERRELLKQRNATAQMWKFIHARHRLNVPAEDGSIRQILINAERR